MIAISSLTIQYGCSSFCTSASVDDQSWSTCSDRMPRCSSSSVAIHISSAVKQSGISVHDSIALIIKHIPGISSLFISHCFWIANLQMNSCGPGLYSILMMYSWMCNIILCSLHDMLATSFSKTVTSSLCSVITLTSWVKQ